MNRPKIALMTYAFDGRPAKGTALYARKLTERLVADPGLDVTLVHYERSDDPLYRRAREVLMPRVRLPLGSRFVSQLLFFWRYRREQFDIIHWFQPRLYPFFWLAPAKHIVVTAHGAGDITAPSKFVLTKSLFNFIFVQASRHIGAIIAVSNFARDEIVQHYKVAKEKVWVTYNGGGEDFRALAGEDARAAIARYGIDRSYILHVGRHVPHKNCVRLIEAYGRYRQQNPGRGELLVIVGTPSLSWKESVAARERSSYRADIRFVEHVAPEHLNALYSGAQALAFVSLNEGFGLPIVEAFASGTPVITSNTTSLPEIAGDAAVLVNPLAAGEIADALSRVLTDGSLQESLRAKGLARAHMFTWQATAEATRDVYARLLV